MLGLKFELTSEGDKLAHSFSVESWVFLSLQLGRLVYLVEGVVMNEAIWILSWNQSSHSAT
jgi:hypothetical protein